MSCCGLTAGSAAHRQDPLVDVDRLLKEYAWERLAELSWWQKRCKDKLFRLEVNWGYLNVSHRLIRFTRRVPDKEDSGEIQKQEIRRVRDKTLSRDLCLFRTEFANSTRTEQTFTFKTERQTKSSAHVTVQKGWRVGADLKLRLSVPVCSGRGEEAIAAVVDGIDPIGITGGLSGQLELKKTHGEMYEETLTWSVDSQVAVEPRTRTVASLIVREEECFADFVLESTIRATHGAIPVHQISRKDGTLLEILEIESKMFAGIFVNQPGFYRDETDGAHVIKVMTRGTFEAVYGAEQFIDIQSYPIEADVEIFTMAPRNRSDTLHSTGDAQHVTLRKPDDGTRAASPARRKSAVEGLLNFAANSKGKLSADVSNDVTLMTTEDDPFATVDDVEMEDFGDEI